MELLVHLLKHYLDLSKHYPASKILKLTCVGEPECGELVKGAELRLCTLASVIRIYVQEQCVLWDVHLSELKDI